MRARSMDGAATRAARSPVAVDAGRVRSKIFGCMMVAMRLDMTMGHVR